jgi:hypothetical protein
MGNEDADGKWESAGLTHKTVMIDGDAYNVMVGANAELYAGVKQSAYAHLVAIGVLAGEVI